MTFLGGNGQGFYPRDAWGFIKEVAKLALELTPRRFGPAIGLAVVRLGECLPDSQASAQCAPPRRRKLGTLFTCDDTWETK